MTLGEKITGLRKELGVSQELLAEKLSVSRQAISKWEMDQALPQIDKVLAMCALFGISTDELLLDKKDVGMLLKAPTVKNKYLEPTDFVAKQTLA